jgi:hypothetical protein
MKTDKQSVEARGTKQTEIFVLLQIDGGHSCAIAAFSNLEVAIAARDERNKTNVRNDSVALDHYARVERVTLRCRW